MLGNPQVVFLDEPTNGLDPYNKLLVLNLIQKISKRAIVFLTTHNMSEIEELCHKILFLKEGKAFVVGN